jgi:G:T-mismatch repair DNA endonuclease (very short patch repair protein)
MLFYVYLMHRSASPLVTAAHPDWLLVEARDAWMRQAGDGNNVSKGQRNLARVVDELGVRHEVERRTDDGYFSMDIYLPEYDVAVEFDGPTHYYHHTSESSSTSRDASTTTRTAKTELRDFPSQAVRKGRDSALLGV